MKFSNALLFLIACLFFILGILLFVGSIFEINLIPVHAYQSFLVAVWFFVLFIFRTRKNFTVNKETIERELLLSKVKSSIVDALDENISFIIVTITKRSHDTAGEYYEVDAKGFTNVE